MSNSILDGGNLINKDFRFPTHAVSTRRAAASERTALSHQHPEPSCDCSMGTRDEANGSAGDDAAIPRVRRRSPAPDPDRRKRQRSDEHDRQHDTIPGPPIPRTAPMQPVYTRPANGGGGDARYGGGYVPGGVAYQAPRAALPLHSTNPQQASKSRRLYVGNIPYHAGLTDVALTQFFSALYIAAFRANRPGEMLPVNSVWLHSDGKFGFMELRGDQEAVNMMQFNGVFVHGRPLRINRPSDYRPEIHNPAAASLVPDVVNIRAIIDLCDKLGGVAAIPAQLAAVAEAQAAKQSVLSPSSQQPNMPVAFGGAGSGAPQSASPSPSAHSAMPSLRSQPSPAKPVKSPDVPAPNVSADQESVAKPADKATSDKNTPTAPDPCVISLRNLVTNKDLDGGNDEYEDIVEDVKAECNNYGEVSAVNIPRTGTWKGTAFVQFTTPFAANTAVEALRTRVFDQRQIVALLVEGCSSADVAAAREAN